MQNNNYDNPYSTFDACCWLETPRWMFQCDVCIMVWPNDTIDAPRNGHKQARISELLDGAFDYFPNLDIADLHEGLI